jgi:2-oxo-4-hydroxy-4-carboxy--5-ureidoimidazoline (OHCU) decarboxylase
MSLPSIEQLNRSSPSVFIEAVNTLFETAPPLADRLLAARPYPSYLALIDLAESVCLGSDLSEQDKLDIINAHPRIGENKTNLSVMSLKEQGYNTRQGAESEQDRQVNATLAQLNKVSKKQNIRKGTH